MLSFNCMARHLQNSDALREVSVSVAGNSHRAPRRPGGMMKRISVILAAVAFAACGAWAQTSAQTATSVAAGATAETNAQNPHLAEGTTFQAQLSQSLDSHKNKVGVPLTAIPTRAAKSAEKGACP